MSDVQFGMQDLRQATNDELAELAQNNGHFLEHQGTPNEEQYLLYQNILNQTSHGLTQNLLARATQTLSLISISRPQSPTSRNFVPHQNYSGGTESCSTNLLDSLAIRSSVVSDLQTQYLLSNQEPPVQNFVSSSPVKNVSHKRTFGKKFKKSFTLGTHSNSLAQRVKNFFNPVQNLNHELLRDDADQRFAEASRANAGVLDMLAWQANNLTRPEPHNSMDEPMQDNIMNILRENNTPEITNRNKEDAPTAGVNIKSLQIVNNPRIDEKSVMDGRWSHQTDIPDGDSDESSNGFDESLPSKEPFVDFSSFHRSLLQNRESLTNPLLADAEPPTMVQPRALDTSTGRNVPIAPSLIDRATTPLNNPLAVAMGTALPNSILNGTVLSQSPMPSFPLLGSQPPLATPLEAPPLEASTTTRSDILARALAVATGSRKSRGEKKPIPTNLKDNRYYERRKRNNIAAKKSRDARKQRENAIASRASLLEAENSVLRKELTSLKLRLELMISHIMRKGTLRMNYVDLNDANNLRNFNTDLKRPDGN